MGVRSWLGGRNNDGGRKPKRGFTGDIEALTKGNDAYRRVLYTGARLQLVLMTLQPGEAIGEEVHPDIDQFFRFEEGTGVLTIDGAIHKVQDDEAVIVPAGARHNVFNSGDVPLRFYTIYGPPEHADGTLHPTRADALADDEHFDGRTSE